MSDECKELLRQELNDELELVMAELGMAENEKYMWEGVVRDLEREASVLVGKINDTWIKGERL